LQYEFGDVRDKWVPYTTVSGFKDSNYQPSYYVGGGYLRRIMVSPRMNFLHVDVGMVGFLMSRRDYSQGDLFPGVLPVLSLGTRDVAVNVTYIPEVDARLAELWFFQLKLSFNNLQQR
jgi:hypothetical protein